MALHHDNILNPITALEYYVTDDGAPIILAGEGSFLKTFDANTNELLSTREIFEGQTIHGIAASEATSHGDTIQVAIWGGTSLMLLKRKALNSLIQRNTRSVPLTVTAVSDWVMDAAISPHDDSCVLITARNTLLRVTNQKDKEVSIVETLSSPSRSILYSADLVWESPSEILVAAGTVFGEIIMWKYSTTGSSQVLHTFTGHEGSIFGVNISSPAHRPDGTIGRFLASCSDDRTIRIWDLAKSSEPTSCLRSLARETGFREISLPNTSKEAGRCIATVLGHASRIWSVRILIEDSSSARISVLSFGEDTTAQHWSLDFEKSTVDAADIISATAVPKPSPVRTMAHLNHLNTFAYHTGKHIWSTTIFREAEADWTVVTGGADGKISTYNLRAIELLSDLPSEVNLKATDVSQKPAYRHSQSLDWSLEDILSLFPTSTPAENATPKVPEPHLAISDDITPETAVTGTKPPKAKKPKKILKDGFNKYAFASENHVLATTNFGRVLIGDISSTVAWSEALLPEDAHYDLKNYAVVEGIPEIGTSFLAGSNGKILAYQTGRPLEVVGNVGSKVADMFKLYNSDTYSYELLVTTLASPVAKLFGVANSTNAVPQLLHIGFCNLPERFVITSAGRIDGLLATGSRSGLLAIYDTASSAEPIHIWTPATDSISDAIATILPLQETSSTQTDAKRFLTTERTGCYSIFSCTSNHDKAASTTRTISISRVHHSKLPFGPMIESAWFHNGELFLHGFRSKSFVVWNATKHYEVSNVDCGGAHRSYAHSPSSSSIGDHFVYTKASKLHLHTLYAPPHVIMKQGGHGREIKASAISPDGVTFATGAEDTAIRIWRHKQATSDSESDFECLSIIEKHTTGIQHLHWHGSKYLFSSGGNEEFFVWAIQSIPGFGIGVVCEASFLDRSADGDLRIMSFDVSDLPWDSGEADSLLISLAFSDSTIRSYIYSKADGFMLLATARYTSSCLTQLRHIRFVDGQVDFLTAGTDGNITLWRGDVSKNEDLATRALARHVRLSTKKIHQSTIKTLDMNITSSYFMIATGGDDNALAISIYPFECLQDLKLPPHIFILRSAHAAAITGLSIVSEADHAMFSIITSGNDQRVKGWRVRLRHGTDSDIDHEPGLAIEQIGDVFTSVADVGDISILRVGEEKRAKALVVGNGMDVWSLVT